MAAGTLARGWRARLRGRRAQTGARPTPPKDAWEALDRCSHLPGWWVAAVALAAVASVVNVEHGPKGTTLNFQLTTITAVLIAVAWLPTLLRVIALTGGGIKTSVGEAQAGGLFAHFRQLTPDQQEESLAAAAAVIDHAETTAAPGASSDARQVRQEIEEAIAQIPRPPREVQRRLREIAGEYERLRAEMKPGNERTRAMTQLVSRARGLWQADPRAAEAAPWYRTGDEGDRIIGLARVQALRDPADLSLVVDAISNPKSAFEQFHALRAAAVLLPQLTEEELRTLRRVITEQRAAIEDGDHHITPADSSRWEYSSNILEAIGNLVHDPAPTGP